jgi:cardiolipin synthase A/B
LFDPEVATIEPLLSAVEPAYVAVGWIIRIAMLVVLPVRRTPQAATSWLLLIFLLPVPGLLLFLAIGRPKVPQSRRKRFAELAPFMLETAACLGKAAPPGIASQRNVVDLAAKLGGFPAVTGNRLAFLDVYDAMIDQLVADIDGATRHVRLLVYIFADDATGTKVIAALARAVARGVICHVLLDAVGSRRWHRDTCGALRRARVNVMEALPVTFVSLRHRGDMRNHRKLFIIDGCIGYVGSQNIVEKDFRSGVTNQEMEIRVIGPVVVAMAAVFIADWYAETGVMLDSSTAIGPGGGEVVAQLLPSGATYSLRGFETMLVWQIHSAKHRVILTTPYFIPDEALLSAMRIAVARGVDVVLIVSSIADQKIVRLAQCSYYDDLLTAGVRLFCFNDLLLHAKNVSIDGRLGIVGSSNIDIRSFQLNEEVSLMLLDQPTVEALEGIQRRTMARSESIERAAWRRRSKLRQIGEGLARLVSPLL